MKRYLCGFDTATLETVETDVLIVGSGIAGLYAGLHIDPRLRCLLVTKTEIEKTNSWLAQGGIAAVIAKDDNFDSHIADTLEAGAGLCDEEAVRVLVQEGPENIRELVELDIPFDTNPEGELQITREGGHSCRRIVHCGGDATGRETTKRLGELILAKENVKIAFRTQLVDLLVDENGVCGAIINDGKHKRVACSHVILATGGIGHIYRYTTNPRGAMGDGIAVAHRAGAALALMEMVQFHPTTLLSQKSSDRLFLISEAVRGEGGILRNAAGEAFMQGKHRRADLAPRDIVTREILKELKRRGETNVYLDVSSMTREFFSKRFPTIFGRCEEEGVHLTDTMIPVRPAQHYFMGGIKTDLDGMTNIRGLYSCGETACTGIHGANRLASNSMLECLVFGRRAARHINNSLHVSSGIQRFAHEETAKAFRSNAEVDLQHNYLRRLMSADVGAVRTKAGLAHAEAELARMRDWADESILQSASEFELYGMIETASEIVRAASARRENVGAHYMED